MIRLFLLFLTSVWAAVCSIRDPTGCEQRSKDVAFGFTCQDAQNSDCFVRMNDQFRAIAPVDYPSTDEIASVLRPSFFECLSEANFCIARFLSSILQARLPASVEQARGFDTSARARYDALDEQCGKAWALENCGENNCLNRNLTCERELDFVHMLKQASKMSVFYAARREKKHLVNMNASCFTQGSAECTLFVAAQLTERLQWLSANRPKVNDSAMLTSVVFLEDLSRPCGGDLPCLKEHLDPLLSAPDFESANRALDAANQSLTRPVLSQEMEDLVISFISQPAVACNSIEPLFGSILFRGECQKAQNQRLLVERTLSKNFTMEARLTEKFKSRQRSLLASCWTGCRVLSRVSIYLVSKEFSLERFFQMFLRFALLLCDTPYCVDAVSLWLSKQPTRNTLIVQTYDTLNDRVYPLLGIILEGLLIVACVLILVLIVGVWRVARDAVVYVILLALLMLSETFMLSFWASLMRNFDALTSLNVIVILHSEELGKVSFLV